MAGKQDLNDALQAYLADHQAQRPVVDPAATKPSPAQTAKPTDGKEQLAQAYDRLVEHEATKPKAFLPPMPAKWKKFVQPAIAAVTLGAAIYFSVAKPAWLYPRFEPIPAPRSEARANQLLIATSVVVQQFQATHGRVPSSLAETGIEVPWVSLMPKGGDAFTLLSSGGPGFRPLTMQGSADRLTIEELPR